MYKNERPVHGMKVRYIGNDDIDIRPGKVYDVIALNGTDHIRIVDESGEDYLYGLKFFEVVQKSTD
jgi:hypothetical protein